MRIAIDHTTRLEHDEEVVESVMDVRLGPLSDDHQRWRLFDLQVTPPAAVRPYTDAFGNAAHLISVPKPHRTLEVVMRAEVDTLLEDPFRAPDRSPEPLTPLERADGLAPTALIPRHPKVDALAAMAGPGEALDQAQELMRLVHEKLGYVPDSTDVNTTVPEVLERGRGVCQDLTHVLIGVCRAAGLPARYVSGYITGDHGERPDGSARGGAGASHGWAEVWIPSHGWRGFDATNGLLASTGHVKMATGRDYRDVAPTRGAFRGPANERLTVGVVTRVLA